MARRKGLGTIRNLATKDLRIQDQVRSKRILLQKDLGAEHEADILSKSVETGILDKALAKMNLHKMPGRPSCAPAAMGA